MVDRFLKEPNRLTAQSAAETMPAVASTTKVRKNDFMARFEFV